MSLKVYKQKRDFKKTSEPSGGKRSKESAPIFVVQEHHASHLHYDFRLEYGGTLKSWAVPKGPSMQKGLRRLAVEVEDHPIDYAKFHGDIPEGEYGAGHVEIWDNGTWEAEGSVRDALKKGHLDFTLHGKKLTGRFLLQRTRGEGRKAQWILLKRSDAEDEKPKSKLVSARPNKKGKPDPWPKIEIELATLVDQPPKGGEWIHEVKFDGYRTLTTVRNGKVEMRTRKGLNWTEKYKPLDKEIMKLKVDTAIFDGEIVALDQTGASNFSMLQMALSAAKRDLVYYIFDLLYLNGEDLRERPLSERKELLKNVLKGAPTTIRYSEHIRAQGDEFLANACAHKLEGIVSKLLNSKYEGGRGEDWVKSKCLQRQEFVIGGYTSPQGSRQGLGALLVGFYDKKKFHYAGRVGTGFSGETLIKMQRALSAQERKTSAFEIAGPKDARDIHWVNPVYVAEISFGSWTHDGVIRHATFQGWREDKGARDVKKETAKKVSTVEKKSKPKSGAIVTHPDRMVYPAAKFTKLDVANYYVSVAPWMLTHVADRPLSLMRCQGQTGESCFFQKHVDMGSSTNIQTATLDDQEVNFINDAAGVLDLVQLGTVEFHNWECHVKTEKPDQIVFDIDPDEKLLFSKVKVTAFRLKEMLEQLDLESFVKTTGGKGLHVHVPITPAYEWDRVKEFSLSVCEQLRSEYPDEYTTKSTKTRRTGKIYLDYLRNGFGATAIAPYSLRAKDQPVVAVPLSWAELKKMTARPVFDADATLKRLAKQKVDPWKAYPRMKQKIKILAGSAKAR